MAKRAAKRWDPDKGETVDPTPPETPPEQEQQGNEPAGEPTAAEVAVKFAEDVIAAGETNNPEEMRAAAAAFKEPEPGPLTDLQARVRQLLDYDQIAEVRLALSSRTEEIEKHLKKASALGIREEDARRRLRLIEGSETRFGLLRIFAPEEATVQRDVFFDQQKPNGRPSQESTDETITFRTVDGRDVTCHLDRLEADHLEDIRALYRAGKLPLHVENAAMDADFMHRIEDDEAAGQLAETAGVEG